MKIMVTGASSMIGRAIIEAIDLEDNVIPIFHEDCDLLDLNQVHARFSKTQPDMVIHAAGYNGGILWNKLYPATIFYRTVQMGLNVLEMTHRFKVKKVVSIISSCSYPDEPLLQECNLWNGKPNSTVECHAFAKRFLDAFSRQISIEHPTTKCVSVILNNSYGPYDNFHPEKTKVVGALIKKFVDAKKENLPHVTCWGTGSPLREFVYSKDAGKLIAEVAYRYNDVNLPLNIGSGQETSIKELAELIALTVGYQGRILWDSDKPDGQMFKKLDLTNLKNFIRLAVTPLQQGIKETVEFYEKNQTNASLQKT